jgi:hypothetical protein
MRPYALVRIALALAFASAASGFGTQSRADPLITQGIGISNCAKLHTSMGEPSGFEGRPRAPNLEGATDELPRLIGEFGSTSDHRCAGPPIAATVWAEAAPPEGMA